jgi:coxsackievirus/adenovirus receptor
MMTLDFKKIIFFFVIEFDQQVQDSKDKAEDALASVPEIRQLITDAQNKTDDARQALIGAEHNAQIARDTAQEAQQQYAEQASQVCP